VDIFYYFLAMLFDQDRFSFTVMLYRFFNDPMMRTNYGILFAVAVIGILLTLLMFISFQCLFI